MRFCDLFISYKIGLNNINNPTSFNKRLFYTKFFIILSVFTAIYLTFILFNQTFYTCILVVMVIFLIVMSYILHYRNRDIKAILENSYIPYSKKRMNMIIDIL